MTPTEALQIRNALKKDSAAKGFIFFSDIHCSNNNSAAMGRIADTINAWGTTYVDAVINAGDTIASAYTSTALDIYKTKINDISGIDILHTMGNHDCWVSHNGVLQNWMSQSNLETAYGSWVKEWAEKNGSSRVAPSNTSLYYYKDYGSVRVIILNAFHAAYSGKEIDGVPESNPVDVYWDATQKSWLQGALADAKTNSKHVLLVNHFMPSKTILYEKTNMSIKEFKKVNEYNPWAGTYGITPTSIFDEGWMPDEVLGVVKDFIDAGGILIGWLGGHLHNDKLWGVKPSLEATYGKQILFQTGAAGPESDLDATGNTHDLYNFVVVNTSKKIMTIVRLGLGWDALGNERRIFVWDYDNKVFLRYK